MPEPHPTIDRIYVIDTETTGDGPGDQVIERASVPVLFDPIEQRWWADGPSEEFYFPTVPIKPEARAVHHRSDDFLAQRGVQLVTIQDEPWPRLNTVYAAHNREFDMRLLKQSGLDLSDARWICTYRCARFLWPDFPSHKNQVLRYRLALDIEPPGLPHEAAHDAVVTAGILCHMLNECGQTVDSLLTITNEPMILKRITFGKHKGELWDDVPLDYLQWCARQPDFDEDTVLTISKQFERRRERRPSFTLPYRG